MNAVSPALSDRYRSVFVSDMHLGTRGCRSDFLADFLEQVSCERLYLVGDIIDGWRLRKTWFWDANHDRVVRAILRHAKRGTEIVYIPGNHDEMFRAWLPQSQEAHQFEVAGIEVRRETSHVTASGKRLLILHGDEFDGVVRYAKFLARLGDSAYTAALVANRWLNAVRRIMGYDYWSLSQWLKRQVKGAVKAIDRFETALAADAKKRGFDGVVCGHIHHAEMRMVDGILYCNTGDWVESCTALVEHGDGKLELVDWAARNKLSFFRSRSAPVPAGA
ncbi:MAG: UDP-2,3-diacylglucosamine diphosphatase [Pseudomonadota bacterium]|nr:UDP-2,3-diacylglucosamine diphosphatase [Pseudomonadota bacterium]